MSQPTQQTGIQTAIDAFMRDVYTFANEKVSLGKTLLEEHTASMVSGAHPLTNESYRKAQLFAAALQQLASLNDVLASSVGGAENATLAPSAVAEPDPKPMNIAVAGSHWDRLCADKEPTLLRCSEYLKDAGFDINALEAAAHLILAILKTRILQEGSRYVPTWAKNTHTHAVSDYMPGLLHPFEIFVFSRITITPPMHLLQSSTSLLESIRTAQSSLGAIYACVFGALQSRGMHAPFVPVFEHFCEQSHLKATFPQPRSHVQGTYVHIFNTLAMMAGGNKAVLSAYVYPPNVEPVLNSIVGLFSSIAVDECFIHNVMQAYNNIHDHQRVSGPLSHHWLANHRFDGFTPSPQLPSGVAFSMTPYNTFGNCRPEPRF